MDSFYGFDLEWYQIDARTNVELPKLFSHWKVIFSKEKRKFELEVSLPLKIEKPTRDHIVSIVLLEIAASKIDAATYDNAFQNCSDAACHLFSKEHSELLYQKMKLEDLLGRNLFAATFFPKDFSYTETTLH